MVNNHAFLIKVSGQIFAVREFVQLLRWGTPFENFVLDGVKTQHDPSVPGRIAVFLFGDCVYSLKEVFYDGAVRASFDLQAECQRLGIVLEAFSSAPGAGLQEHYLCNKGVLEVEEQALCHNYFVARMTPREVKALAEGVNSSVDALMKGVKDGWYSTGGLPHYGDFRTFE